MVRCVWIRYKIHYYLQFNNIAQPEVTNDVRIENLVLINETNIQLSWDPPSLLPFVDPNLYQVNIRLYTHTEERIAGV